VVHRSHKQLRDVSIPGFPDTTDMIVSKEARVFQHSPRLQPVITERRGLHDIEQLVRSS